MRTLLGHLLGRRCTFCRERHRYMDAHVAVDHFGEVAK